MQRTRRLDRRALLRRAAAGVAFGGLSGAIQAVLAMSGAPTRQGVNEVSGEVRVNGVRATVGMAVSPGDTVVSGPDGSATIVVGKDAFLVRANTRVVLGASGSLVVKLMRVTTGRVLSVFSTDQGERRIETTVATIGVRGTGIYVESEEVRSYACTCYGEAELAPRAAPRASEVVRTRHHESPRYIYGDGRAQPVEQAPVINHTDAELTILEALVGRVPLFFGDPDYGAY